MKILTVELGNSTNSSLRHVTETLIFDLFREFEMPRLYTLKNLYCFPMLLLFSWFFFCSVEQLFAAASNRRKFKYMYQISKIDKLSLVFSLELSFVFQYSNSD